MLLKFFYLSMFFMCWYVGYKRDQANCLLNFITPLTKLADTSASIISVALG